MYNVVIYIKRLYNSFMFYCWRAIVLFQASDDNGPNVGAWAITTAVFIAVIGVLIIVVIVLLLTKRYVITENQLDIDDYCKSIVSP